MFVWAVRSCVTARLAIGSVDKRRGHAPLYLSLRIDDETQLDAQSYNMHVPDHDNNSATDERHGYCNHADVSRPYSYDYDRPK